jgi:F-type H+-transporting ATPase subunit b
MFMKTAKRTTAWLGWVAAVAWVLPALALAADPTHSAAAAEESQHGHGGETIRPDDPHAADQHAQSPHGTDASGHGAPNPLAIGPDLALVTAVIFLVLLAVLTKFAWRPIVEVLDRREQSIADNIAAAAAQRDEAERLLKDYENRLADAASRIREMLEEGRRDAEATKAHIIADAKTAARAEQQRALNELRSATDTALRQLADRSAELAVELAAKILDRELNSGDHARLIRDSVAQFPSKN